MKKIIRKKAIRILAEYESKNVFTRDREAMIFDIWHSLDKNEKDFQNLSQELKNDILNRENPDFKCTKKYDELVILYIIETYKGVKNEFIANKLEQYVKTEIIIEGKVEALKKCPCCSYKTLEERGQYFICPVCFWEDDGNNDPEKVSSCNQLTLKEARLNFEKDEVITEKSEKFEERDNPKEKYEI